MNLKNIKYAYLSTMERRLTKSEHARRAAASDWVNEIEIGERVVTVATSMNEKRTKLHYAIAVCAPKKALIGAGKLRKTGGDTFRRDLGRKIALGRLTGEKTHFTVRLDEETVKGGARAISKALYTHASKNKELPSCARAIFARNLLGVEALEAVRLSFERNNQRVFGARDPNLEPMSLPEPEKAESSDSTSPSNQFIPLNEVVKRFTNRSKIAKVVATGTSEPAGTANPTNAQPLAGVEWGT